MKSSIEEKIISMTDKLSWRGDECWACSLWITKMFATNTYIYMMLPNSIFRNPLWCRLAYIKVINRFYHIVKFSYVFVKNLKSNISYKYFRLKRLMLYTFCSFSLKCFCGSIRINYPCMRSIWKEKESNQESTCLLVVIYILDLFKHTQIVVYIVNNILVCKRYNCMQVFLQKYKLILLAQNMLNMSIEIPWNQLCLNNVLKLHIFFLIFF